MENERILVADDRLVVRQGIERTIEAFGEEDGHQIVGQAESVEEVEELLKDGLRPTVALVDGRFPDRGGGERAAKIIEEISPETTIIAFSSDPQNYGHDQWNKYMSGSELVKALTNLRH